MDGVPVSPFFYTIILVLSRGVEQSRVIGGILVTVIMYVRHALFLFICILRCVKVNMQIRLNEGPGYFQSEFKVDTKGEIITLVLLHPLRQQSGVLQGVFAHILVSLMDQSYNTACCGG